VASKPVWVFLACLVLFTAVPGCDSKEEFETCEMSEKMKSDCDFDSLTKTCDEFKTTCYASCMVGDHPQCLDGPCMIFQFRQLGSTDTYKSTPFCTMECKKADPCPAEGACDDCPKGSTCLPFLDKFYCVPDEHIVTQ